ncbi:MAG: DUF4157 domain-containing protein [Terriglobia bacterium]
MKTVQVHDRKRKSRGQSQMASRRESGARLLRTPDQARERQAEETAWAWSRGEKNLARKLGDSPASGRRVAESAGEPLPDVLRSQFEDGFGAKFGAVRIHRDAAAGHAARREGALAFASGAHIYFGEGVFDINSESGRRLIAHELTHVLQQTGRAGRDGMEATDLAAGGPVQKADAPEFKDLVRLHAPDVENQQYDQVVKDLKEALNGDDEGQPDRVEAYAKASLAKVKDWPAGAESLLYDVLKELNRLQAAAALLERDDFAGAVRIKTTFGQPGIQKVILDHGGVEAFAEGFTKDKDLKAYYDEFLRIVEVFIFQPLGLPIPELYHQKSDGKLEKLADHIDRLQNSLQEAKSLSETEWFEGALEMINTLDIERVAQFTKIQHQTDDLLAAGGVPIARKQLYATAVVQMGKNIAQKKIAVPGTEGGVASVFYETLGGRVEAIGKKALDDFDRAAAVGEHPEQLGNSPQQLPAEALLFKAIQATAAKHGMPDQLLAEAKELFKPGKDKSWPPPADEYTKRVGKIADDSEKYSRLTLEKRQSAAFHQGKTDEAVALIWLTTWLYLFARALRQGGTDASYDGRLAHQIRMAQALESIAFGLGWNAVLDKAHEVAAAEKQATSQLALVSEWEEDKSRLEALAEDVPDQAIRGYEPLRAADLVLFFQKIYLEEAGKALTSLLPADSKEDRKFAQDAALNSAPLVGQAAAKADAAVVRPKRYLLSDSAWANKPGRDDFSSLLGCHQKTVTLLAKFQIPRPPGCVCLDPAAGAGNDEETKKACEGGNGANLEAPDGTFPLAPVAYRSPLFLWIVPGIAGVVNTLKGIPLLRDIVASKTTAGAIPTPAEWLQILTKYFASASEEDKKELQKQIRDTLRRDKKQVWEDISPNLRRASTIDRRVRARVVTELLGRYASDHIKFYGAANDAIMRIVVFAGAVVPFEDREVQRAALILSVGPAIVDAFKDEGRYDIVTGLYGPLEAALKLANMADANLQLAPFFEPDEVIAVLKNAPALAEVLEHFKTQRAKVQRRFGFRALEGSSVLKSLVYGPEIKLNERMPAYDGTLYTVVEIRHGFTFHPAYGTPPGPGQTGGSSYSPPLFLDEADQKPLELAASEVLLVVEVGKDPSKKRIEVTAGGDAVSLEVLNNLSYAVEYRAFNIGMKELGIIIQKYIELLMDAGEFIPGVGQAITATRLLQTAAEFYDQGGYQAVKGFFAGEVRATLDRFMGDLANLVNPENLWVVILFGDARLDNLLAYVSGGSQEDSDSNGDASDSADESVSPNKFGFVRKVVNAFKKLGLAFARLVRKVNLWVEKPMQDLRAFATTRPILSFVLSFLAEHIFQIFDVAQKIWEAFHEDQDDPDRRQTKTSSLQGELVEQQKNMGERIHGVMEQLEHAQLPEKVIDIDAVVSFIVHKLTFFVGKRLGTKGKIVTLILEETGAIGLFSDRIAHEIVGAGADPNIYWRETIKPAIQDNFNEARNGLVGGINSALEPFQGLFTPVAAPPPINVGFTSEEFEETKAGPPPAAQPQPAADLDLKSPAAAPAVDAGTPLSPGLRERFEGRFGQDFQHVRMHQGVEGGPMTSAFGADALTTGSHVFLRPGLNAGSGRGEETTRHELMHVIQQTGSKPLGGGASSTPSTGAPGRGLVDDPMLERAADEAAKQQPNRNSIRAVDPGAAAHMGMQPALDPRISPFTLGRFFRLISTLPEIKKREETIAKGVVAGYEKEVPDAARTAVAKVVAVLTAIEANVAAKKVKPAKVFTNVIADISKYLADQKRSSKLTHGSQVIALESMEDIELPGQAGAKQKKTEKVLKIPRFERELEAYVLAATGIGITLDLKTSGKSESGKDLVDSADPVKEIKIVHVHLPWVEDDFTDLWTKAIQDDGKGWGTWKGLDSKTFQQYKGVLLPLLESKGVAPGVWAFFGDKYQFSDLLKSNVSGVLGLGGAQLPADKLPPWREYVKTDPATAQMQPSPIGHVGVRLATYQDDASQTSQGRESHHLTQYLLADYFANQNPGVQPFDKKKVWPGVKFDGKRNVIEISNPDDPGKPIKVNETRGDDRGGRMPAISLAAVTHRRGSLHLTPEPDDINHKAKSSQASAVQNEFRANVGIPELFDKRFDKYMATAKKDDVAKTIYIATQRTYKTVRDYMANQLNANMADLEFEYYKGIALGSAHDLSKNATEAGDFKTLLQAVPKAARAHNEKIMKEDLGWDPSK